MDLLADEDNGQDGEDYSIRPVIVIIDEVYQLPNEINGGVDGNNEGDGDDEPVDVGGVSDDSERDDRSLTSFATQEVTPGIVAFDLCYVAWEGKPCFCSSIHGDRLLGAQCFHCPTKKLSIAKRVNEEPIEARIETEEPKAKHIARFIRRPGQYK